MLFLLDFSILRLSAKAKLNSKVGLVCLPPGKGKLELQSDFADLTATISGWGRTAYEGPSSSKLLKAQVTVLKNEECKAKYLAASIAISEDMVCAGKPMTDTCQGDSGGKTSFFFFQSKVKRVERKINLSL